MDAGIPPAGTGPRKRTLPRRVAPAVALFFLAPLSGEFLIGNVSVEAILVGLLVLAPMYGGGALIVREAARRAGRGWPTILLLGLAYGVLEAGLIDQSMFNPSPAFLESPEIAEFWEESRGEAFVPALGVGAQQALGFVTGHAVTSIGVPILVVETFVPGRRTTPWLGKVGLTVTGVLFVLGSLVIHQDQTETFRASVPQMLGTAAVVVTLIGIAFAVGRRPRPGIDRPAPNPWAVAGAALTAVLASSFATEGLGWVGVTLHVLLIAAIATLALRWSRRVGWGATHRLALGAPVLLTDAMSGFVLTSLYGRTGAVHVVGNVAFTLAALVLVAVAARTAGRTRAGD